MSILRLLFQRLMALLPALISRMGAVFRSGAAAAPGSATTALVRYVAPAAAATSGAAAAASAVGWASRLRSFFAPGRIFRLLIGVANVGGLALLLHDLFSPSATTPAAINAALQTAGLNPDDPISSVTEAQLDGILRAVGTNISDEGLRRLLLSLGSDQRVASEVVNDLQSNRELVSVTQAYETLAGMLGLSATSAEAVVIAFDIILNAEPEDRAMALDLTRSLGGVRR